MKGFAASSSPLVPAGWPMQRIPYIFMKGEGTSVRR
jgi:hypothetical protein